MLSDTKKSCLNHFLQTLDDNCLKRLSGSITNGRMTCSSREDAVSCILLHSESLESFFDRKKVGATLLLNYLHSCRVSVPGDAPKDVMLEQIFKLWNLPYQPVPQKQYYLPSNPPAPLPIMSSQPMGIQSLQLANPQSGTDNSYTSLKQMIDHKKILKEADAVALEEFVYSFAAQFYELLNKPDPRTLHLHSINSTHIYSQCKIKIVVKRADEDIEVVDDNCESALKHLSELRDSYKVFFCPNLSAGNVYNKKSVDGLLCVMVLGTLHHPDRVWGSFKQTFILSADPFSQNSYKIRDSELILTDVPNGQQMLMQSGERVNPNGQQMLMQSSGKVNPYSQQMLMQSSENANQLAIESNSNVEIIDVS